MFSKIVKAHSWLVKGAKILQHPFLLFVRLYWGWQFFQAGWGKFMHFQERIETFRNLHIPMPALNLAIASSTECFGGLLLMVGLFSRLVSVPLAFTMLVAYITADPEALKAILSDPDKFIGAAPFSFGFAALIVLCFGPGCVSLDRLIDVFWIKRKFPGDGPSR